MGNDTTPVINLVDVSLKLNGQEVLSNINVAFGENELVVIFGPNGAGKTTLLKLISGQIAPSSGSVRVVGLRPSEARKFIGYVPQLLAVQRDFPITVLQAVMTGLYSSLGLFRWPSKLDRERAHACLDTVGLADFSNLPLGKLSGGQIQRAFIARALVSQPKVLLLDEAISGVDLKIRESIYELLVRLKQSMTILLVTHDMSVVSKQVDRVVCLNRNLVSHGSPEEALTEEALKCMYGDEMAYFSHCSAPHVHVDKH